MASNRKPRGIYEIVVREHQKTVLILRGTDLDKLIGTAKIKLVGNKRNSLKIKVKKVKRR